MRFWLPRILALFGIPIFSVGFAFFVAFLAGTPLAGDVREIIAVVGSVLAISGVLASLAP